FSAGLKRRVSPSELNAAMASLQVLDCADALCRSLSAGQRRRVALCGVLLSGAQVWVLDEPFTNLDAASGVGISEMLARHLETGGLVLIAAHQGVSLRAGVVKRLELG